MGRPAILLIAVVTFATSCSSGTTDTTTTPVEAAITTTTAPTTAAAVSAVLQGEGPFEVTTTVVSHETTRDISVWAPDAEGSWPVVYLIPAEGSGQDLS
jgi:acetyl esterase/lipase